MINRKTTCFKSGDLLENDLVLPHSPMLGRITAMKVKNPPVHEMILSLVVLFLLLACTTAQSHAREGFSNELNYSRNLSILNTNGRLNACANPIKGKLSTDDHKASDGCAFDLYFFKGVKFEKIDIKLHSKTMDYSAMIIYDSNNKQWRHSNFGSKHHLILYLPESGTYRIFVTTQQPFQQYGVPQFMIMEDQKYGNYELSVRSNYIKHWQDGARAATKVVKSTGPTLPNQAEPGDLVLRRIVINPDMVDLNPPSSSFTGYIANGMKATLEMSMGVDSLEVYEQVVRRDGTVDTDQRGSFKLQGKPPLIIRTGDEMEFTISAFVRGEALKTFFECNFAFSDITSLDSIEGHGFLEFSTRELKSWKREKEGWSASRQKRWVCLHTERPLKIYWGVNGRIIQNPGVDAVAFEYGRAEKREVVTRPTPIWAGSRK